jgi:hypothetical protein
MAAFEGAQTSNFALVVRSPGAEMAPLRSARNLPTKPLIVFVFPVPGGLRVSKSQALMSCMYP